MNHVATPTNNNTSMSLEDILPQCPTAEECAKRLDGALDDILFKDGDGKMKPRVCFCCDTLLSPRESHFVRLSTVKAKLELLQKELQKSIKENNTNNSDNEVHPELIKYYKYDGVGKQSWMDGLIISPRACLSQKKQSFLSCGTCMEHLKRGEIS